MKKVAFLYIDDVIWAFRDLTRQRPASLFDQPFLGVLLQAHRQYGAKVQLNLFFRTDYYYGNDEFTLADMTDAYKGEFEANSHWLRFSFHAKQEFPDYPHINADHTDFKDQVLAMQKEVVRFAGEQSWTLAGVVGHWVPMSKDACRVLAELGTKLLGCTDGATFPYDGDPDSLPYGHAGRLLNNRKPETRLCTRPGRNAAISRFLCGYNHVDTTYTEALRYRLGGVKDPETGLLFRKYLNAGCINLCETEEQVWEDMHPALDNELACFGTHEQYFFPEYFAYQPNLPDLLLYACRLAYEAGCTFVTGDELAAQCYIACEEI